jgi:hypothetical protein
VSEAVFRDTSILEKRPLVSARTHIAGDAAVQISARRWCCWVLCDDVRRQLVFDESDAVAQQQLALFQTLHLNDIGARRGLQRRDGAVEVAVHLPQAHNLRLKLTFFRLRHCQTAHCRQLGARVRVCHDGCIVVRINDRGPWVLGRHIDLSPAAARAIKLHQTGRVTMSIEM